MYNSQEVKRKRSKEKEQKKEQRNNSIEYKAKNNSLSAVVKGLCIQYMHCMP